MHYHFVDIEITRQLEPIRETAGAGGIALLVRRATRPIGFIMRETKQGAGLSVPEMEELIGGELKVKIVSAAIADELTLAEWASGAPPSLTNIVCTRAPPAMLARCLDSIRPLRHRRNFELLVIDNAPPDNATAEVVRSCPDVRRVVKPRPGLDFALNRGWREATGELVAFLDDDGVVDSGHLDGLDEACGENPDAGAFTGLVMPLKLESSAQVLFEKRNGFRRGFEKKRYGARLPGNPLYPTGAGIFGAGCSMVIRRSLLEALGGFDEALDTGAPLPGGGDLDIFYRIVRSNHPLVYEPRMMVFHEHRATEPALRRQCYTWGLGFMAYLSKTYRCDREQRPILRRLAGWWFMDQVRQLRDAGLGRHALPASMILAELWDGIVGLSGGYARSLRRIQVIRHHVRSARTRACPRQGGGGGISFPLGVLRVVLRISVLSGGAGQTVIVIAHRISTIENTDQVIVLEAEEFSNMECSGSGRALEVISPGRIHPV